MALTRDTIEQMAPDQASLSAVQGRVILQSGGLPHSRS